MKNEILADMAHSLAAHMCLTEKPASHKPNLDTGVVCYPCQQAAQRIIAEDAGYITGERKLRYS